VVATVEPLEARRLLSATTQLTVGNSWFGNSNPTRSSVSEGVFMPQGIQDMYVSPAGTVWLARDWEEGGGNITQVTTNGVVQKHPRGTFGWGHNGQQTVTSNSTYVYFGADFNNEGGALVDPDIWPPAGLTWKGISRRLISNTDTGPAFAGGKGGKESPAGSFLPVYETPVNVNARITGLYATESELFSSSPYDNLIRVYDANTMAFKRSWTVNNPGKLAMDTAGRLWVSIGTKNATQIVCYDINGNLQPQAITLPAGSKMGSMGIDPSGRMLIGDRSQNEQVLFYTNLTTTPTQSGTFGTKYGVFSGTPGALGPQKFNQVMGVGADSQGNIYVANTQYYTIGEGIWLEKYNAAGELQWRRYCVVFTDVGGADASNDGADIYGATEHYTVDYSKPMGQQATLVGYTANPYKYPYDPRFVQYSNNSLMVRTLGGQKFVVTTGMGSAQSPFVIYRFNPATDGEVMIPAVIWSGTWQDSQKYPHAPKGNWLWRDLDANGQMEAGEYTPTDAMTASWGGFGATMDINGAIWSTVGEANLYSQTFNGLDANGIPIYDGTYKVDVNLAPYAGGGLVKRVRYVPSQDMMYLMGGVAGDRPRDWMLGGNYITAYANWSAGNRTPMLTISQPNSTKNWMSMDVAGDYLFAAYDNEGNVLGQQIGRGHVNVYNRFTGEQVGFIRPPVGWDVGWMDVAESISVFQQSSGQYVIIQEDDGRNKNLMYLWNPTATAASAPTFGVKPGAYDSAPLSVALSTTTSGATIRYTTDGSQPTSSSTLYTGPLSLTSSTAVKAIAFKSGLANSSVISGTYSLKASTPQFGLLPSTYTSAQSVALTSGTPGATIRYTTDGSDPTASSPLYGSPLNITATTTLKARAFVNGLGNSDLATGVYTISPSLILSPGFEGDNSAWRFQSGRVVGNAGNRSVSFNNRDGWAQQTINVRPNTTYVLSAQAGDVADKGAYLYVTNSDGSNTRLKSALYPANGQQTLMFTTGSNVTSIRIGYFSAVMFSNVDNFAIVESAGIAPPSSLTATGASPTSATLTWTDASNETSFLIERASDASFTQNLTTIPVWANQPRYRDTGLTSGNTYYYRVKAVTATDSSSYSNTASATIPFISIPIAPTNLLAPAASSSQINLTWTDNSNNQTSFKVERATNSSFTQNLTLVTTTVANATSYINTGLSADTTYYFRVRATNADGDSANSNFVNATTPVNTDVILDNNSPGVTFIGTWNTTTFSTVRIGANYLHDGNTAKGTKSVTYTPSISPAGKYIVQIYYNGGSSRATNVPVDIVYNGGSTTVTLNQSINGGTWFSLGTYPFAAGTDGSVTIRTTGTTQFVIADAVRFILGPAPADPSGLTATPVSSSQINLTWTDNSSNETGFKVERATDSGFTQNLILVTTTAANATSYNDTGLSAVTTYFYRVRATNTAGDSANSATASATTPVTIPSAPGALGATAVSSNQINLTWTDNSSNETGFQIDRATNSGFTANLVTSTVAANATSTSITGLLAGTTYYFRVRAVSGQSGSSYSASADATTQAPIASARPTGVSLQAPSDTGTSNSDGITKLTIGLKFRVTGTVAGATVTLYDGGTLIGSAIAAGTTTTITTNVALADGLHNAITAKQTEVRKSLSLASSSTSVTIDTVVPAAPEFSVNLGQNQRSMVNTLSLVFSEKVIVPTGGLLLQSHRGSPTSNINLILNNASGDGVNYTVRFSGTAIVGNSLPDGIYNLIAKAVLVQDVAGNALATDAPFVFHRLLGDANGNRKTNMADNRAFVRAIGTSKNDPAYRWFFDFNNDDKIDMADNRLFVSRLGTTLNI